MTVSVSPVTPAEYEAAARLLFARAAAHDLDRRVGQFLGLMAAGEVDPSGLLVARRGGELVGVAVAQFLSGGSAVVVPPLPYGRGAEGERLAAALTALLRDRGAPLAYSFLDPADVRQADPLVRCGFRSVTRITHMLRLGAESPLPPKPSTEVTFTPAHQADPTVFGDTLLATYDGTLDVPEACVDRPAADILTGYRANQPDPPHWWLAADRAGRPVGVVLLTVTGSGGMDLGYLGVPPAARGRGVGKALLRFAVRAAAAVGSADLNLSVDARNEPALRLYRGHSFRPYQWQQVFLWRPSW